MTGAVVALPGAFGRAQFDGLGDPNANVTLTLTQPAGGVICSGGAACPASIPAVLTLDQGGSTSLQKPKAPPKPKGCYSGESDSEIVGSVVGSGAVVTTEIPHAMEGLYALGRGARLGAVIGELAGPEAVPVGLFAGGIVGGGAYLYDKHSNGALSRKMNQNMGKCP